VRWILSCRSCVDVTKASPNLIYSTTALHCLGLSTAGVCVFVPDLGSATNCRGNLFHDTLQTSLSDFLFEALPMRDPIYQVLALTIALRHLAHPRGRFLPPPLVPLRQYLLFKRSPPPRLGLAARLPIVRLPCRESETVGSMVTRTRIDKDGGSRLRVQIAREAGAAQACGWPTAEG
jgi:hypothetical protein